MTTSRPSSTGFLLARSKIRRLLFISLIFSQSFSGGPRCCGLLPRFSASGGLAASVFPLCPRCFDLQLRRILWPGRALDSVLPPGFRPLPSFHLRHACLDSHAKHFLDGCFLDTRGTPPTVSWKRFESGFCSRSRVIGFSCGFSRIPFLLDDFFLVNRC